MAVLPLLLLLVVVLVLVLAASPSASSSSSGCHAGRTKAMLLAVGGGPVAIRACPRSVHRFIWPSYPLQLLDRRRNPAPDNSALDVPLAS
jgi:hypothetical protein